MNWSQRTFGLVIVLLYVAIATGLVYVAYIISPPTNPDQWKEFGVRAGLALTAAGALTSIIASFFTLGEQIRAGRDLEEKKKEILLSVETRKKELLEEIEKLKAKIARQSDLINRALNAKSIAYDKLFVATNNYYRELQNLEKGQYDVQRAKECQQLLQEAEGLAANLSDEDLEIVRGIVQVVFNIVDKAEDLKVKGEKLKEAYKKIWDEYVKEFGDAMEDLRSRSLFYNKSLKDMDNIADQ